MKRLTTAYEWTLSGKKIKGERRTNASYQEVVDRLGEYEDAEEEGRLFITPCKPGDMIYEVDVIEHPEWDCYVNGFVVQDVSAKQVKYSDDWADWDTPYLYTSEKAAEAKARQLRNQRNRLESHTIKESGWIPGKRKQPELPMMKNNAQRREWLRKYKEWGLWYEDENIGCGYYKYDFGNGARLIAETYTIPGDGYIPEREDCYFHLVGGPEAERKNGIPKWNVRETYSKYPNSEAELTEFLKSLQKGK